MSNYSDDDRIRSIRRFVMMALGSPPWTVRTETEVVADDQRPLARIEAVSEAAPARAARVSIPQGMIEQAQGYAITLYPELGETGADGRQKAFAAASRIRDALGVGISNDDGSSWCPPERMPIFDFTGVAVAGASRAGPSVGYGWFWVEAFGVRPIQDPDDVQRWTVGVTLRLSWEQAGRAVRPAPVAGSMDGEFVTP